MQGRTECEAAGQQKRLIFIDAQLKILPAQAEFLGHEPLQRGSDWVPPHSQVT